MANRDESEELVERIEAYEERMGVTLESLAAFKGYAVGPFANGQEGVWVSGELRPRDGLTLKNSVQLVVDVFDADGRIIGTANDVISKEGFYGHKSFSLGVLRPHDAISKVRVYPEACNTPGDVTHLIERLEVFEERAGVRLEALFAKCEDGCLKVTGELHSNDGASLDQSVEIILGAYDSEGRLIVSASHHMLAESFFGFQVFCFYENHPGEISKLRLYPKPF